VKEKEESKSKGCHPLGRISTNILTYDLAADGALTRSKGLEGREKGDLEQEISRTARSQKMPKDPGGKGLTNLSCPVGVFSITDDQKVKSL